MLRRDRATSAPGRTGRRRPASRRLGAFPALLLPAVLLAGEPTSPAYDVAVVPLEGPIGPAGVDHVERSLARAAADGARLVVLRLDTPGGLDSSMRAIVRNILALPLPVVGHVAPPGARAASAGTYVLYAAHAAAMAPGTNLGAATPVRLGGAPEPGRRSPEPATPSERKAVNDAAAYIRGLAELRGRNADWAEAAVRRGASLPAGEALRRRVIDLVAPDVPALLRALDGRTVRVGGREVRLRTAGARVETLAPDLRARLLGVLADPNVAGVLLLIGVYGLLFEFVSPGVYLPGVAGAVCLILGLYALQVLPVSLAGVGLMALGLSLAAAELVVPSFGALGIGGIIAFAAGWLMLMDVSAPGFAVSYSVVGGTALAAGLLLLGLAGLLARGRRRPVVAGRERMIGSRARVLSWEDGAGRVATGGENWAARGPEGLRPGRFVRIVAVDGLVLRVTTDVRPSEERDAP